MHENSLPSVTPKTTLTSEPNCTDPGSKKRVKQKAEPKIAEDSEIDSEIWERSEKSGVINYSDFLPLFE